MLIKKLPENERSLLVATSRINTYKKAVEQLVYNSLDADATSIAIRINIDQSSIQVIDNGCGITKSDMDAVAKRHMTSKYTEDLKSIPNKYGLRGESLANIVEISKIVRITSRHESSDQTWEKDFRKGKNIRIEEVNQRPSKGTTVDIKGFLYNRYIQIKSINALTEIQVIKILLEHISLVHTNISISLRDDSRNEITFQLHKKRDIHQTLSSLYSINKSEIQELKVEKNDYSVTAFITKQNNDCINKDLIFLNRKIVDNTSKLHKIVNDNLNKYFNNQYHRKKSKIKYDDEEIYVFKNQLPFYFLLIHCPMKDYDTIDGLIEFNDWNQVTRLLEKLVTFYANDVKLKPVCNYKIDILGNGKQSTDTRDQVKKIMNKILASDSNALGVSQMRNGIKGKISKRTNKKKHIISSQKHPESLLSRNKKNSIKEINIDDYPTNEIESNTLRKNELDAEDKKLNKGKINKTNRKFVSTDSIIPKKLKRGHNIQEQKTSCIGVIKKSEHRTKRSYVNPFVKRFINPTESVKKRCEILAQNAQNILANLDKRIYESHYVNKSIQCNHSNKNCENMIANKETKYSYGHDKFSFTKKQTEIEIDKNVVKSAIDLIKPAINLNYDEVKIDTVEQSVVQYNHKYELKSRYKANNMKNRPITSKLTYESHNYEMVTCNTFRLWKPNNLKLISNTSFDNFTIPNSGNRPKLWQKTIKNTHTTHLNKRRQTFIENISQFNTYNSLGCSPMPNIEEYSQNTFDIPKSNKISSEHNTFKEINTFLFTLTFSNHQVKNLSRFLANPSENVINETFTLSVNAQETRNDILASSGYDNNEEIFIRSDQNLFTRESNVISIRELTDKTDDLNVLEIHESDSRNSNKSGTNSEDCAPINVCEAVYLSNDVFEKEFEFSFNNNKQKDILNEHTNFKKMLCDKDKDYETYNSQNNSVNCSHHFNNNNNTYNSVRPAISKDDNAMAIDDKKITDFVQDNGENDELKDMNYNENYDFTTFNLKNRLRFVPKGMSPIFKKCTTKQICENNLSKDYYDETLYNNFVNDVQVNTEIYEAQIQNVKDNSKHPEKRMGNGDANDVSLDFDGKSLKDAFVLNQVDNKFIIAIITNNTMPNMPSSNFLVLFDQHAVHERIRLENNMAEYFNDRQWKSISVDPITMVLSKEDKLYLHNYKDKFTQLGLQWTMTNGNEIAINSIPEAILGKNLRQADKIINAVRNLFTEQINNIKLQKGCISLYPKSIMDLIFSEACRYAVMFGDRLTKDQCRELIQSLSKCKKPFQCAHGRPVMAVIMDLEHNSREYKANLTKLKKFKE